MLTCTTDPTTKCLRGSQVSGGTSRIGHLRSSRGLIPIPRGKLGSSRIKVCKCRAQLKDAVENPELLVGDGVLLVSFTLYKQISAIVMSPSFPGWLAPLRFNPARFIELASFASTLVFSWIVAGLLVGAFRYAATRDVPACLRTTSSTWLVAMPVAAAQLLLTTAAKSSALVGDEGWASQLPLAASGPGEPFVTAAGVLGVLSLWRTFYCVQLDRWSALRTTPHQAESFKDAVLMVLIMAGLSAVMLEVLSAVLTPDQVEALHDMAERMFGPLSTAV